MNLAWRWELLRLKLGGSIDAMSWLEVARAMGPRANLPLYLRPGKKHIWKGMIKAKRRELPDCILWETPTGEFWTRASQGAHLGRLMREQVTLRIYENGPVAIRPGDVVLDGGSHVGTYSRLALNHGARLVVAFEPEPDNVLFFRRNLGPEIASGKVVLIEAALWNQRCTLPLHRHRYRSGGHSVVSRMGGEQIAVATTTIDETVRRVGLDRVDMIKLDVEGAEEQALAGARETLVRFGPRIASCVYHQGQDLEAVRRSVLEARPDYQVSATRKVLYFHC
jgi:FkbM family methyltransferase